ncbi:MAG: spore cortex biosynthesis protein YabQ [Clostridia bacterium]
MLFVYTELHLFLGCFIFGIIFGLVFELVKFIKVLFRNLIVTNIVFDTICYTIFGALFFISILVLNQGEFVLYELIGYVSGFIFFHYSVGILFAFLLKIMYNFRKGKGQKLFNKILR